MNLDDLDEAVEKTDIFLNPSDPVYHDPEAATQVEEVKQIEEEKVEDVTANDEAIARELAA